MIPVSNFQFHISCLYFYRRHLEETDSLSEDASLPSSNATSEVAVHDWVKDQQRQLTMAADCNPYNSFMLTTVASMVAQLLLSDSCASSLLHANIDCFPI